ncbi:MAG: hypothetical protein LCH46_01625 [Proteobacteria bacterium]|nr:hypothetical protein [Pseudomonadota bacterium]
MAALRESELAGFLKSKAETAAGLLVYGSDAAGVAAVVERIIRGMAAGGELRRFRASELRVDPALFDEAVRAMSLLGGRELIIVEDCDDSIVGSVSALGEVAQGNFALLVAGSLSKASKLRKFFEEAGNCFVLPVYEPKPADILQRVTALLAQDGLRLYPEAEQSFMGLCGNDAALAQREAEKLALYMLGGKDISAADVIACCGAQGSDDVDAVIGAALEGDFLAVDRALSGFGEGELRSLFPMMASHLARLQGVRADFDSSGSIEGALRNARPPVFFGIKDAVSRQVRRLSLEALMEIHGRCEEAVEMSRKMPELSMQIGERALFSIAQFARASR